MIVISDAICTLMERRQDNIVPEDGIYPMTRGRPVPNSRTIEYQGFSWANGCAGSHQFNNLEDSATEIRMVLQRAGPVLAVMETAHKPTYWRNHPSLKDRQIAEAMLTACHAPAAGCCT